MNPLKLARRLARKAGLDVQHHIPANSWSARLPAFLDQLGVSLIFDVGANTGQFAQETFDWGYRGEILSFEPLYEAHATLCDNARASRHNWQVATRCALGAEKGTSTFYEAGNSVSSSMLAMMRGHEEAAPNSVVIHKLEVPVQRLDAFHIVRPAYVKIDVQGAEMMVLQGATGVLDQIAAFQLEMNIAPLYEGQASPEQITAWMADRGFELWDLVPGFRHPETYRLLQYDAVYVRSA